MRRCDYCGDEFKPAKPTRRFCSKRCSNRGQPRGRVAERLAAPLVGTFYERNAERVRAEQNARYRDDPEFRRRKRAQAAARKAHPDRQPCERCGGDRAERHHDDYDRPLVIRWLCRRCHVAHHAEQYGGWGEGLRAV